MANYDPLLHELRLGHQLNNSTTINTTFVPNPTIASLTSGGGRWRGAVLAPNGNIYALPSRSGSGVMRVSPDNVFTHGLGTTSPISLAIGDCVLGSDGNIYSIPNNSTDIYIFNPVTETSSTSTMGATLTGTGKWSKGVVGPDGKIYGIPYDSTDILIIDPITQTATRSAMGADLSGAAKWYSGCLGPDGKIYCAPYNATDILIIDPIAGTASRSTMGADLSGSGKYGGITLASNGLMYTVPMSANDIMVIDSGLGLAARNAFNATYTGTSKWIDSVLGPDGKIYGVPYTSTLTLIIDPIREIVTTVAHGVSGTAKMGIGALNAVGNIIMIPEYATVGLVISNTNKNKLPRTVTLGI